MAIRRTRHITKNSDIVNRPLATDLLHGEAIVNTAEGIVWYSGVTTSTDEWTPAGTGTKADYFEVGSNLFDLKLRNQITSYQDISGAGLNGKFLSGTTTGFVLADISNISGVDTYVTNLTYDNANTLTISRNLGQPDLSVLINQVTGLTVNGILDATNIYSGGTDLATLINNGDTFVTGGTITTSANNSSNVGSITLKHTDVTLTHTLPFENTFVASGLMNADDLELTNNDGSQVIIDLSTLNNVDTYVTNLTNTDGALTFTRNQGQGDLTTTIDTLATLSVNDLTTGRVVYVDGTKLSDDSGFEYNDVSKTMLVGNLTTSALGSATIGDGGVIVGSGGSNTTAGTGDVVIHGDLTVFGDTIEAFTSQLYIEDNNISLNYNPSSPTMISSIGAGFTIQDGNGISGGDVNFDVRAMDTFTGINALNVPNVVEYTSSTGYENRAFITQLNDIVIRSNNVLSPNGVRVLGEFDILDGGSF